MNTLYLFTASFPFGTIENFLEDEILYTSKLFSKVVIISFTDSNKNIRPIPENCEVININISKNRYKYIIRGLFHPKTVRFLTREFFRSKVLSSKKRFYAWGSSARYLNNCLYDKKLRIVLTKMNSNDVAYFYWGIGQCLLSIILKKKTNLVSRFHGEWDLWEESYGNFHSLRNEVAKSLDKAVFISKKGESYFKERYPYAETCVFPLGSKDYGLQLEKLNDNVVRVVSCSTVYPLKRVPLIFEALNSMTDIEIEWTHLGGGSHFQELKEIVEKETKSHLSVNLVGMVSHDEVMNYYKEHHFDLFINMSTSEGVPVSIMEAMSFGIPILATDVGSTAEEVPKQVGELLSPNPSIEEIIAKIRLILSSNYSPRKFWNENYNADKNYSEFANMLYNLSNNAKLSI